MKNSNMNSYQNPLVERYASDEISYIFSPHFKFMTWRKLWVALAEAQKELGLDISESAISAMKATISDINFETAEQYEKDLKHDVMSHIKAWGDQLPEKARKIIHLGATSAFVTDNTELIQMKTGLKILLSRLNELLLTLRKLALENKSVPMLGFTHFQIAQPVTLGKRISLWLYEFYMDTKQILQLHNDLKIQGVKGTTGTMASFFTLFNDFEKPFILDNLVAKKMGFERTFPLTGQTYTRKSDYEIICALSGIGQSSSKFATDIRLLQHRGEVFEPFGSKQVGSSAMPYKRNPMKCERIVSLSRLLFSKPAEIADITANQWFERTLDDSALRRIIIPEAFLAADAILLLCLTVAKGLDIQYKIIQKNLKQSMPFLISEELIAKAFALGMSRQDAHQIIRDSFFLSKETGKDLFELLKQNSILKSIIESSDSLLNPSNYIGLAPIQVEKFIADELDPFLDTIKDFATIKSKEILI